MKDTRIGHCSLGLGRDVAESNRLPRVEILPDLAAKIDRITGYDRLAEVIVEILLGVGVAGIEGPDAAVGSHESGALR